MSQPITAATSVDTASSYFRKLRYHFLPQLSQSPNGPAHLLIRIRSSSAWKASDDCTSGYILCSGFVYNTELIDLRDRSQPVEDASTSKRFRLIFPPPYPTQAGMAFGAAPRCVKCETAVYHAEKALGPAGKVSDSRRHILWTVRARSPESFTHILRSTTRRV